MNLKLRSWLGLLLVVATFLALDVNRANGAADWLHCSTTVIRPGDFFRIQVEAEPQATVTVLFLNQTKSIYPVGPQATFIGLAAASYRAVPGKYPITVTVVNGSETLSRTLDIEVVARQFVEQRIAVSEKKRKATATEAKTAADARVGVAVRQKVAAHPSGLLCEGVFIMPLKGRRTSDFGLIRYVNNIEHGRHSGWDLAGVTGTPVAAMNRGRVVFAGKLYSSGKTVIIHHGLDLYTSYAHLSKIRVKEGSMVAKGQTVGNVGMTGLATGPHLHLTVRVGEIPVDPALLVGQTVGWQE
jgi:murein DD-endopeptidase MepM/ murein hydrolase activator NlpD